MQQVCTGNLPLRVLHTTHILTVALIIRKCVGNPQSRSCRKICNASVLNTNNTCFYLALIIATDISGTWSLFCVTWAQMIISFHLTVEWDCFWCAVSSCGFWYQKEKQEQAQEETGPGSTGQEILRKHLLLARRRLYCCLHCWAGRKKIRKLFLGEYSERNRRAVGSPSLEIPSSVHAVLRTQMTMNRSHPVLQQLTRNHLQPGSSI